MKKSIVGFLVLILMIQPTSAVNSRLYIAISDVMIMEDNSTEGFVKIAANLSIFNTGDQDIEFSHPDLCEYKLNISSELESVENSYPFACALAIKTISYPPGNSTATALGGIHIINGSKLPDGTYFITLDLVSYQLEKINTVYNATITVSDQKIENIEYDSIGQLEFQNEMVPFPTLSILFSFVTLIIIIRRRADRM